mmetsp:Transcript_43826/g.50695  ORF Transcript_43826/g.50695 Transcript_43826/m.50695 type:complete len:210 (+) Transcript_43826:62-691(+)|eukprot:CAMPEP_0176435338 /NCGR_PEP_ID=MMETSP0127-20121128/17247_1 /TAXON_ID=938130 /ORGANISM="Platyophrya macrostoma, Strain WH" /LENGTH=209 /DNA_ID=CAMNT_0017818315 /DNA_START=55 /DNA_END=684 /DNA_ORIENTATION=-
MSAEVLKAIKEQTEENDSLDELVLDQIKFSKFTPEVVKAIEKIKGLSFLSLNDCGLTSLEGFPNLPSLIRCEVTDNKIPGSSLSHLAQSTELQSLSLGGNPINSIDDLKPLTTLTKIVQLDLFGCPVSEQDDYREKVFALFPNLQILDNKDAEGEEVEYDDEEGEDGEGDDDEGEDDEYEGDENGDDDEEEFDEDEEEEDEKPKKKSKK